MKFLESKVESPGELIKVVDDGVINMSGRVGIVEPFATPGI